MPLHRRMPKRGFRNPFGTDYAVVNVDALNRFSKGEVVTPVEMMARGLVASGAPMPVKVLGDGELKVALTVQAHKFSKSAVEKITSAGGKTEILQ